ncbi:hypothetical protein NA56DRAFT_126233 [Hyaloscypha hepaticicola]|uniref:Mcm6 C-terminal winged-helix domain-containing protein n=1 Tax=Hyaloscypha hepaticicola TaxID=2082293 RepID=A0A2J6Q547_9HELO|nr:hypothetical protein NA56DRAFT_126233 [Hyaloscypha hepaticicola]
MIAMSHDKYTAIRRFIVRHIQDQDFAEDHGIPGRVLIYLCLERFYPEAQDPEAIWTEKKSVEGVIRRMVEDSMLQPVSKNQKVVFRLDPYFNIKDKMNPTASQPSEDPQSTQEALEALERETSPEFEDRDVDQQMDDDLDQQLAQQLDESMHQIDQAEEEQEDGAEEGRDYQVETHQDDQPVHNLPERLQEAEKAARLEATRHAEAYAEITRGAAPMPRIHTAEEEEEEHEEDEDPIRTPGRKRRKVMAIAPSDASSSMDSISPGKYPNSTPRRRRIRLGTPLSASRRRSAP